LVSAALTDAVLVIAGREVGVHEVGGQNRGPRVEQYLAAVGVGPGSSWCVAFIYWCFAQAAGQLGVLNPMPRTGGGHKLWDRSPEHCHVGLPRPGAIAVEDHGSGLSHVWLVAGLIGDGQGMMRTIEGNTDHLGSRNGYEVARRQRLIENPRLLGYVDFGQPRPPELVA
jgi:hypothetical protein